MRCAKISLKRLIAKAINNCNRSNMFLKTLMQFDLQTFQLKLENFENFFYYSLLLTFMISIS